MQHEALVVLGLVAGALLLARVPTLRRQAAGGAPGPLAAVSIVVPARNEERTLPVLLASLASSTRHRTR